MAYKIRETPKELTVDEAHLMSGMERMWFFAEQHRRAVFGGMALICIAAIVVGAMIWMDHCKGEEALTLEQQAIRLYLDRPFDQPEKTKDNIDQAITLYRQVIDQYPRTSSAQFALYLLGNALMDQQELKGAISAYQEYVDRHDDDGVLLGLVYQRLGYAHLMDGNQEKAVEAFTQVLNLPEALNKDQVLFEFGKLEEEKDRPDGALTRYNELVKRYPHSPFTREASMRVKALTPQEEGQETESEPEEAMVSESESGKSEEATTGK